MGDAASAVASLRYPKLTKASTDPLNSKLWCHRKEAAARGLALGCHYYPPCPQPNLTLGTSEHTDNVFITVLLQDHIGGLQIPHQEKWVDVPPVARALVVNIGELMQLITNDRFISVAHRVLPKQEGPRISVARFFSTLAFPSSKVYRPIKELLSEENPPKYRETTIRDFHLQFCADGLGTSTLQPLKL